jgi:hypothetical protein
MSHFQIRDAKPQDCGMISRRLRDEHLGAVRLLGISNHHEIRRCFEDSWYAKAWLHDGVLLGLGGVTGPMLSSQGTVWLALSKDVTKFPVETVKEARRQVNFLSKMKRELFCTLLPEDETSLRFANRLGFEQYSVTPIPYGAGRVILMKLRETVLAKVA